MTELASILSPECIADLEAVRAEMSARMRGTYAGMRWPDESEPDLAGVGKALSIQDRAKLAYWDCIHCGHHIQDTKKERMQLCDSYTQDYSAPHPGPLPVGRGEGDAGNAVPREVCFIIPFEAAWDNRFEKTVTNFLTAKRAKEQGNDVPLQDWFLSERALFYERGQTTALELAPVVGSYNPKEQIPNQHSVNMLVDCQKAIDAGPDDDRVGSFWVIIEAVDKFGNSWDLSRNFCTSWEQVIALQKKFGIPNGRVCVDGRKWTPAIMQKAAEHFETTDAMFMGRKYKKRATWMIFMGDDAAYYKWPNGNGRQVAKPYSMPHEHRQIIMENGRPIQIAVFTHLWSNLSISDQLHEIMLGGEGKVKIHTLGRDQLDDKTRQREQGDQTYDRQINAEYRTERRGKPFWEKKRPDNHYLDCRKMGLVRKMMDGLAGGVIDTTSVSGQTPGTGAEVEKT